MKSIRKTQLEHISFDNNDLISISDVSKIKKNHEKIFLPFINERDGIGRLVGHSTDKLRSRNINEKSFDNSRLSKMGLLTKIYKDTQSLNYSNSEKQLYDNVDYQTKKFINSIQNITTYQRDISTHITDHQIEQSEEQEKCITNFDEYDYRQINQQKDKKKFLHQGSQLKLLSPKFICNESPPFGTYDIENAQKFVLKKNPACFIAPEKDISKLNIEKKNKLPEIKSRIPGGRKFKISNNSELDYPKYGSSLNKSNSAQVLPKEALVGRSPFNYLSLESQTSDLMRFNQIMTVKFEDTRSRLHELKLKIDEFAPVLNKDK